MISLSSINISHVRKILLSILSISLIISCSKDDSQNQNPSSTPLIKTETRIAFPLVFNGGTYTYDNLNRLIYLSHANKDSFSLKYNGNVVSQRYSQFLLQESDTLYYFLNSRNLADSSSFYNGQVRKKYTYDSEGYLIDVKTYDSFNNIQETESYTIQNGNIVYYAKMNSLNEIIESISYSDFDTAGKNTIGNINYGKDFLGRSSVHFAQKIVYLDGNLESTYKTRISYDGSGRITSVMYLLLNGALDFEDRYEYY